MPGQEHTSDPLVKPRAQAPLGVKSKPFEAQYESSVTTDNKGSKDRAEGLLCRDSEGRTRMDYRLAGRENITVISDSMDGTLLLLDNSTRYGRRISGQQNVIQQDKWAFADCIPIYTEEYGVVNGVRCRRVLLKNAQTKGDLGETWLSEDLSVVMREVDRIGSVSREWHIKAIEFKEPDAARFVAPTGYRLVTSDHQ